IHFNEIYDIKYILFVFLIMFLAVVSNRVSVTSQPNWSLIYRGEKVTLRCEIQDDGGTEWTYEWKPTNRNFSSSSEYMIISATDADSGEYSCKGRRATLTAEMRIIPAGGSVTLTCSVDGSTGWKFDWFENGQYYPVVGSSRNTEPDGTIRVSEGEEYNPVTLSCRDKKQNLLSNVFFYHNNKLINNDSREELNISAVSKSDEGFYKCQHSGKESLRSWMSVRDDDHDVIILVSPVHPVTEGDPVTLSCRDKEQNLLSNVFFYHNNKLINNDSREELNISAVSKSDEGFYKCQHSGKESPRSWMSVRGEED
uniref:Ig-like domain-containing protein n=1 Tax=Xiphophorus maculatus TaxID=8083 RepID=A0A3B5QQW0_XIPMA